ncbi:MAG: PIN domain-containing protein [Luteolibacter sp.]
MNAEYFMDTNVFIYAFSPYDPQKRSRAADLIKTAVTTSKGVISTQVFQEFLNVAHHKPTAAIPPNVIEDYIDHVLTPLCRVFPSPALYKKAIQLHQETQYRFYDSLILAAALESGATTLYSEDLQHDRTFGHLRIVNPFL